MPDPPRNKGAKSDYEKAMEIIIHDARNLIEQINVSSQLLQGADSSSDSKVRELAGTIEVTSKKIESLISSYTKVLQIERKQYLPQPQAGIVSEKIMALVTEYNEVIQGRNLLINLLNKSRVATIETDWFCLELAIRNILRYAVHESPEGETVTILLENPGVFKISVHIRKAMSRDKRAGFFGDLNLSDPGHPDKIGLYTAKKMVHTLDGRIFMTSSKKQGTAIRIELPLMSERR